jgi:predicted nuclease of predicted toxin-antitoxin system
MKLLLDQNLSPRLVDRLADVYPDSAHVLGLGLDRADDRAVWNRAHLEEYVIVSKDADFSELSVLLGFPPKVLWIRRGNCSTREIEILLRKGRALVEDLAHSEETGILLLS